MYVYHICVCMLTIYHMLIICFILFSFRCYFPLLFRSHSMPMRHIYNTKIQLILNVSREILSLISIINTCIITISLNLLFPIHFVFDYCFQIKY